MKFCRDCKYYEDMCNYDRCKKDGIKLDPITKGRVYSSLPKCIDYNSDGNCKFYQAKPSIIESIINFFGFKVIKNDK